MADTAAEGEYSAMVVPVESGVYNAAQNVKESKIPQKSSGVPVGNLIGLFDQ